MLSTVAGGCLRTMVDATPQPWGRGFLFQEATSTLALDAAGTTSAKGGSGASAGSRGAAAEAVDTAGSAFTSPDFTAVMEGSAAADAGDASSTQARTW